MKKIRYISFAVVLMVAVVFSAAQVNIPNQFSADTVIVADEVNANFKALKDAVDQLVSSKQATLDKNCVAGTSIMAIAADGKVQCSSTSILGLAHTATATNTVGPVSEIDSPLTNAKPDANLLLTQDIQIGFRNDAPVGVAYNGTTERWYVTNLDGSNVTVGAKFNVMVVEAVSQ